MKLCTFTNGQIDRLGIVTSRGIIDLELAGSISNIDGIESISRNLISFLSGGHDAIRRTRKLVNELDGAGKFSSADDSEKNQFPKLLNSQSEVRLRPPITNPQKIFCVATNYPSHLKEVDAEPPPEPYFFCKFANSLVGSNDPVAIPKASTKVDYEGELAVIIGKRGKYISRRDAYSYVGGYCVANDVSYRDLQKPPWWPSKIGRLGQNWVKGKALDCSLPIGPYLVTPDEIINPYPLRLITKLNGEVRQDDSTSSMIFKIPEMLENLSSGITLEVGDIILTGTPSGAAQFADQFLKADDTIEVEIERIGAIRNQMTIEMT